MRYEINFKVNVGGVLGAIMILKENETGAFIPSLNVRDTV
jgi:hypothetical protein